jgi:hypothetical protein
METSGNDVGELGSRNSESDISLSDVFDDDNMSDDTDSDEEEKMELD